MGYFKSLSQEKELSLQDYISIYSEPRRRDKLNNVPQTLLTKNENLVYVYCVGNNTILVMSLDSFNNDNIFPNNHPFTVIKLKPIPDFFVEHIQFFSSSLRTLLIWGSSGIYILKDIPKIIPALPSSIVLKGLPLEEEFMKHGTIVKCDTWSYNFNNTSHLFFGIMTATNYFSFHKIDNFKQDLALNKFHTLFTTVLSTNYTEDKEKSLHHSFSTMSQLNINAALGEDYIDFVIGPLVNNVLTILILQGTGAILAIDMALSNVASNCKISTYHMYNAPISPAQDENPDLEYTSLSYIPSRSPGILVVVQRSIDDFNDTLQDPSQKNFILRHLAILTYNQHRSKGIVSLYLLESLGLKLPLFDTKSRAIVSSSLHNDQGTSNSQPGYVVSLPRPNAAPLTLLVTMPWVVETRKMIDIFLSNPKSPVSTQSNLEEEEEEEGGNPRDHECEEISDLITYNVSVKSKIQVCDYSDPHGESYVLLKGCCFTTAAKPRNPKGSIGGFDETHPCLPLILQLVGRAEPGKGSRLMYLRLGCLPQTSDAPNVDADESGFISRLIDMVAHSSDASRPEASMGHDLIRDLLIDVMYSADTAFYDDIKSTLSHAHAAFLKTLEGVIEKDGNEDELLNRLRDVFDKVIKPAEKIIRQVGSKNEEILVEMVKQKELKADLDGEVDGLARTVAHNRQRLDTFNQNLKRYFGRALKLVEKNDYDSTKHGASYSELLRKCKILTCSLTSLQESYVKLEMAYINSPSGTVEARNVPHPPNQLDLYCRTLCDQDAAIGRLVKNIANLRNVSS